jgi:hypothetical protein
MQLGTCVKRRATGLAILAGVFATIAHGGPITIATWAGVATDPVTGLSATLQEFINYNAGAYPNGASYQYNYVVTNTSGAGGPVIDEFGIWVGAIAAARAGGFFCDFVNPPAGGNCSPSGFIASFFAPAGWDFAVQEDAPPTDYLAAWSDIAGQDNQAAGGLGGNPFNPGSVFDFIIYSANGPVPGGAGVDPGADPMSPFLLVDVGDNLAGQMVSDTVQGTFTLTSPEPGTLGLLVAGIVGLGLWRRRG